MSQPEIRKTPVIEGFYVPSHTLSKCGNRNHMTGQDGKPAKVSLARITIDAPPGKVAFYSTYGGLFLGISLSDSCKQSDPNMQVYQKLAQVGSWNNWHTSAWVLRSPGLDKLVPGEKFAYTAPFVLGNVQSQVEESHDGKVGNQQYLLSQLECHSSACHHRCCLLL